MKRTVPMVIAGTTGFVLVISYFIPYTESWGEDAMAWFNILAAVAFLLGGGNLVWMQLKKISEQQAGWGYAAVTLVSFLVTLYVGLFKVGARPTAAFPEHPWAAPYDQNGSVFWWCVEYLYRPLASTMFALLAFFISSAAFRAFRAKNAEATILLATAFIVLLGRTHAGTILTGWFPESLAWARFDNLTNYFMLVFNLAGMRAIMIGIALGVASTSLKVLLGADRSYLGSGEE